MSLLSRRVFMRTAIAAQSNTVACGTSVWQTSLSLGQSDGTLTREEKRCRRHREKSEDRNAPPRNGGDGLPDAGGGRGRCAQAGSSENQRLSQFCAHALIKKGIFLVCAARDAQGLTIRCFVFAITTAFERINEQRTDQRFNVAVPGRDGRQSPYRTETRGHTPRGGEIR